MEKVKLPKEVAKAIERVKLVKSHVEIVEYHASGVGKWDNGYLNTVDLDTLIKALYLGYEVEETPEDKVKSTLQLWESKVSDHDEGSKAILPKYHYLLCGALEVLDILNIKIEGVNT